MRTSCTLFALLFLAAGTVAGQQKTVPLGARLKMYWQDDKVLFREGDATHEVSLHDQFQAVRLDKVTLQSAKEAGGFTYVLLDVTGPSKLPRDSHQCGGGNESNLIWLKLDKDWKILDEKSFLYDSCWRDSSAMMDPPKWSGDTLTVTTMEKVATYSYKHPEEGLKVVDVPAGK